MNVGFDTYRWNLEACKLCAPSGEIFNVSEIEPAGPQQRCSAVHLTQNNLIVVHQRYFSLELPIKR